jgi:large subunit ribosomal protein L21
MYAIVEIAGQQFKIEQDQQIFVHRLEAKEGSKIDFDKVLLMDNAGQVNVGAPVIKGAKVTAKVLEHLKGDKVIVFKKKRRKGYKVKNGHRQYLTKLEILKIEEKASAEKKVVVKNEATPAVEKAPVKKIVTKKPVAKKEPVKKTVAKKPVAKKEPVKKTVAKKPVAKKEPVKKTVAKKPAAKKEPVKKTVAKKPAAKKAE